MKPDVYRNILAGIAFGGAVVGCAPQDIPVQRTPTDKGPGEVTLHAPSPTSTIDLETPRPGWKEHISLGRYNKFKFRFQLPPEWSFRDEDQTLSLESKPEKDLTQMASILIATRLTTLSSDSFAEQFAGFVDDKTERSTLEYIFEGEKVMSYVRKNPVNGQEEHILGFVVKGVGVGIKISAPSERIQKEKGDFQHFLDALKVIPVR